MVSETSGHQSHRVSSRPRTHVAYMVVATELFGDTRDQTSEPVSLTASSIAISCSALAQATNDGRQTSLRMPPLRSSTHASPDTALQRPLQHSEFSRPVKLVGYANAKGSGGVSDQLPVHFPAKQYLLLQIYAMISPLGPWPLQRYFPTLVPLLVQLSV